VVGGRLWVCFPWSDFDRTDVAALVEIDPGRAFGTGRHPSTLLLLEELVARLRGGESVLDVGTGSGVLSVSAAVLGARSVLAIDRLPEALDATRANAARNGMDGRVTVSGTRAEDVSGSFDVVLANLHASSLRELAPVLEVLVTPGGWLGLSGLSPAQVPLVTAAYVGMKVEVSRRADEWAAVIASPRERPS
jgi:ribosomal protein L11 methyltransferase